MTLNPVSFPSGTKDVPFQTRLIEAKWRRFYPLVAYHPIIVRVIPDDPANLNVPASESGTTAYDALWGESIDPASTVWKQPHLSGDTRAAAVEVFADPVNINMRIYAEDVDGDLKEWGMEQKLDLTVVTANSLLDAAGVQPQPGDWFLWDGKPFEVRQVGRNKRYTNTALTFYAVLNCTSKRQGS